MPQVLIRGKVISGKQRGKVLGFPTANLKLHKKIPEGIYISQVKLDNKIYQALAFIGKSKTFKEGDFKAETYILYFNEDIYNKWVSIKLLKKIRENQVFKSSEELISQMKKDEQEAIRYFRLKNV